ncbi:MAG: hypothetical protein ABI696_19235, partial [Rubrivivax sp.]
LAPGHRASAALARPEQARHVTRGDQARRGNPMTRVRAVVGIVTGIVLLLSSVAHSLLGWSGLDAELQKAGASQPLVTGLQIGWQFAGAAMLGFGCIVLLLFTTALRGRRQVSLQPALVIGLLYCAFSAWALAVSGLDPFFLIFLIPGLALVACSWPPAARSAPRQEGA